GQDMTFSMTGLVGDVLLRANLAGACLETVQVGGADVTDRPHEFRSGDKVTIVLTTQTSTVTGSVTDDSGAPVTNASILLFASGKNGWRENSVRIRRATPDAGGQYRLAGVLPGNYYVIAAPRNRINIPSPDAAYFESLSKDATPVVVGDSEQRTVDLKFTATPSGGGL
ncbi:MAG TPA: carboxypeptidase-like regulatory domain-containing protein, partial [Vicinamibacterales bacterium]